MSLDLSTYKAPKAEKTDFKLPSAGTSFQFSKKLSDKKKEIFYRELGMLLKSGVDFKKALEILSNQSTNKFEKEIIIQQFKLSIRTKFKPIISTHFIVNPP